MSQFAILYGDRFTSSRNRDSRCESTKNAYRIVSANPAKRYHAFRRCLHTLRERRPDELGDEGEGQPRPTDDLSRSNSKREC
jgi:hypothetical protein